MTPRGDLRAWFPLTDASLPPHDHSVHETDATLVGEPTPNHAGAGGLPMLRFTGGEYVDLGTSTPAALTSPPITLSAVFYTRIREANQTLISMRSGETGNSGYTLLLNSGRPHLMWGGSGSYVSSIDPLTSGSLHHLAVRVDTDNGVTFFVDGTPSDTATITGEGIGSPPVTIGGEARTQNFLDGGMADTRVYRRALPDDQIAELADRALARGVPFGATSYYPFDGTTFDQWGNKDGTLSGATLTDGYDGGGVEIGLGISVEMGAGAWGDTDHSPFSYAAWIYPYSQRDSFQDLVGTGEFRRNLVLRPNMVVGLDGNDGGTDRDVNGSTPVPTNQWSHVAATFDGSTARIYLNGELDGEGPWDYITTGTMQGLGVRNGNGMDGRVDDLYVYPRELDADEIGAIYANTGPPVDAPAVGLVRHYPLNGTPAEATDATADGAATNLAYASTPAGVLADFNGTDSVVDISVPHLDKYTVAAWVSPDAPTDGTTTVPVGLGANNDISLTQTGSGGFIFTHRDSSGTAHQIETAMPFTNGLYHLALTYDGARLRAYANGGSVGTTTAPDGSTGRTNGGDRLGMDGVTTDTGAFDGQVGGVRVQSDALGPLDIRDLYTHETTGHHRQYHFATR